MCCEHRTLDRRGLSRFAIALWLLPAFVSGGAWATPFEVVATAPEIVIAVGSEFGLRAGATGRLCQSKRVGDATVEVCPVAFRVRETSKRDARIEITRGSDSVVELGFEVRLDQRLSRGVVSVRSNVLGDRVSVDGKAAGETPARLSFPGGTYAVLVEKDGYRPWRGDVTAIPGQVVSVWARLEPIAPQATPTRPHEYTDPLKLVAAGSEATERGDHEEAVRLFERLLELRPEDPYALKLLGEARSRLRQRDVAAETASEIAYLQLALDRARNDGDAEQLRFYARGLLALDPDNERASRVLDEDRQLTAAESKAAAEEGDSLRVRELWAGFVERWFRDELVETSLAGDLKLARNVGRAAATLRSRKAASEGDEAAVRKTWQEHLALWPEDEAWLGEEKRRDLARASEVHQAADEERRSPPLEHPGEAATVPTVGRGDGIDWVPIPTGRFRYGCTLGDTACGPHEATRRDAVIAEPFLMARFETTNAQYASCVEAGACSEPAGSTAGGSYGASLPVERVSWFQAAEFCEWLGGRLPTGVEWEFAAREIFVRLQRDGRKALVNTSRTPLGQGESGERLYARYPWPVPRPEQAFRVSRQHANYVGAGGADSWGGVAPVGQFPANSRGLHDMAGNVAERVQDGDRGSRRGEAPADQMRFVRGGSYLSLGLEIRVSSRKPLEARRQAPGVGFRCVRSAGA